MRLSARPEDEDWDPIAHQAEIRLDGVRQRGVLVADEEKGEIILMARDELGRLRYRDDEFLEEIRTGKVEIGIPLAERQRIIFERMRRG